ncbi:MAG: ABC transporter ATP-binding protein [Ostreibacterium sp.]
MAEVIIRDLVKVYGRQLVVRGINLDIQDGSFTVLVGPSGCGKSTTLRMIAGLESISYGELSIGGKVANDLPAKDRGLAMVFQNYALYPHLTVRENLAFSLKLAKTPKREIEERINETVSILELQAYLDRKPSELSGGQCQRVAMGRAIIRKPALFLFDEPLSNLDAKLRNQMRIEIKKLQHALGVTTIYVTHDQVEAMTLADIIVVMKEGQIVQQGSPLEIFSEPSNKFVASFIGSPQMNFFDGLIEKRRDDYYFVSQDFKLPLEVNKFGKELQDKREITVGLRPEDIVPEGHGLLPTSHGIRMKSTVNLTEALGNETLLYAQSGNLNFVARMQQPRLVLNGENIIFHLNLSKLHLFDKNTEERIQEKK